jgi:WD40 repeat protein
MDDNNDGRDSDDDEESSAIIFIDMRQYRMMGSYFESHSDSVNCLASHPHNHDRLMSGGADALVNWFDLRSTNVFE